VSARLIFGVQPVLEAIRSGREVERVWIARSAGGATSRIRNAAKKAGVPVSFVPMEDIDRRATKGSSHQGVLASVQMGTAFDLDVDGMLDRAESIEEDPLIVLLDGIEDPQNLGAILRSAYALGAHGVVLPQKRAAGVTPAVVRASAGAALHVPITRVTNLKQALEILARRDVWTAAATLDGTPAYEARLDGPLGVVIGGEQKGVRPSLVKACDLAVTIPLGGDFDSLNASVAAGILLYEARRQRGT
jgi:23S rRNA (guanosine2251-2'-O)-methyltransferase